MQEVYDETGDKWLLEYDTCYFELRSANSRFSVGGPVSQLPEMLRLWGIPTIKLTGGA